ncbi:MAG: histidine kinase, partial [Rudanella sp.]|nr:histidine kinase [Rudanella sp.]
CEVTYPLRRHDREYRWFLTCVYPVKDDNGTIERWIGTSTDITEQKSFTEALEEKVKERTEELKTKNLALELTNAELASFSFIASHDLKEPLRKIQAFSKLITDTEKFSDKTQDYFNRIISAVARMQNLIDSLLNLSRTNTTELIFVPCDLNTIVDESIIDLNLSILEKQATVDYENLPIIMGVYTQMSQLFTNLIGNDIKYSRPEIKPHSKITSSIAEGKEIDHPSANNQKDYYVITITDNGIGFEKEYATKIFKLFQRLHNKNEYSGTGIGLAIVKKIVTNHNGFIVAEGKPNIGSTFTIYFPNS